MKIFKTVLLIIILLVLIGAGYGGYLYSQVKNAHAAEQVDLGVSYNVETASTAISKAGVEVSDLSNLYLGSQFVSEGTVTVSSNFSDAEISAIQNYANEANGPFKNVQLHFIGDGRIEGSGFVSHPQINAPVYAKGSVTQTGPKSFAFDLESLKVGDASIPSPVIAVVESRFTDYVNNILGSIEGLNVRKIEIGDSSAFFDGDIPKSIR